MSIKVPNPARPGAMFGIAVWTTKSSVANATIPAGSLALRASNRRRMTALFASVDTEPTPQGPDPHILRQRRPLLAAACTEYGAGGGMDQRRAVRREERDCRAPHASALRIAASTRSGV